MFRFFLSLIFGISILFTTQPVLATSPNLFPSHFELSGWIDLGLTNGLRGYWYDLSRQPETPPSASEIKNAKKILSQHHHLNAIYLITHQQFTLEDTKRVFLDWKNQTNPGLKSPALVPTLVLQNYASNIESCNYSNQELRDQLSWFKANINSKAIAIYDVYDTQNRPNRQGYCDQLPIIQEYYDGQEIIRVGIQPVESLSTPFTRAVQDTYGGFSAGYDHNAWNTSCSVAANTPSAKDSLISWVQSRLNQNQKVAWDLVIVGFDYSVNPPCGTDRFELDHPLPTGRNQLGHDTIVSQYHGAGTHPLWAGFSIDYKIINAHSRHKDTATTNFYHTLKQGQTYQGYFQTALNEAVAIMSLYNSNVLSLPGDLNSDGKVDIFDYQRLISNFGNPYTIFDYQKVISNFGQ